MKSVEQAKEHAEEAATYANRAVDAEMLTQHLLGIENVPLWNITNSYMKGDIVRKSVTSEGVLRDHVFRANNDIAANTAWSDSLWTDTSVWGEIQNMKAGSITYETVRIAGRLYHLGVLTEIPDGESVAVIYNDNKHHYTFHGGLCEFYVPKDTNYQIVYDPLEGYYTPSTVSFIASMSVRTLHVTYQYKQSGWFGVKNASGTLEEVPMSEWNPADNEDAIGLKYYGARGHYFIPKNFTSFKGNQIFAKYNVWIDVANNMEAVVIDEYFPIGSVIHYVKTDLSTVAHTVSIADARNWYAGVDVVDFDGDVIAAGLTSEELAAHQAYVTRKYLYGLSPENGGHTTLVNDGYLQYQWDSTDATNQLIFLGSAIGKFNGWVSPEVPAATFCRNKTLVVGNNTYYGDLPTAGVLLHIFNNMATIRTHLTTLGVASEVVETFALGTSTWGHTLSSSQSNQKGVWFLGSDGELYVGGYYPYQKTGSYEVLVVFDL